MPEPRPLAPPTLREGGLSFLAVVLVVGFAAQQILRRTELPLEAKTGILTLVVFATSGVWLWWRMRKDARGDRSTENCVSR